MNNFSITVIFSCQIKKIYVYKYIYIAFTDNVFFLLLLCFQNKKLLYEKLKGGPKRRKRVCYNINVSLPDLTICEINMTQ